MLKPRLRFAPSPTGPLHIGGLRTALFNYLFARQHQGDFLLRIEDTDQTRYVPGAEEYIIESLKWCGLTFNEGVSVGGPHAPYRQSERKDIYKSYADQLVASGNAYLAFDEPETLENLRKQYEAEKKIFAYDIATRMQLNNSLALPKEQTEQLLASGIPYVVRFKMPENKTVEFHDLIRGHVSFKSNTLDDKILFKSDGMPTYHLANVVDDRLMKITHVIRGEEWLPSTPLHVLLYESFGWAKEMPVFAHLPLILKPSGQGKLSKRDGDKLGFPVFPLEWKDPATGEISMGYRESGYFPDAVVNILAFLGWNPGTEQELFNLDELVQAFSLEKVSKAGARFDPEKAKWYNHQYLQAKNPDELLNAFASVLKEKNVTADSEKIAKIIPLIKERCSFVREMWDQAAFFFVAPHSYDEKVVQKRWSPEMPSILEGVCEKMAACNPFSSSKLEETIKDHIASHQLNMGQVMNVLRLLLVGTSAGPHLFDIMDVLGKNETLDRIHRGIQVLS